MATSRSVPLRAVALPTEHGIWGFWLEPSLLGLLLVPSFSGLWLVITVLGALLAQQPFSLVLADRRRGKYYPRTKLASRFLLAYGLLALLSLLVALWLADSAYFLLPLLFALPLALVQVVYDARNQGRKLLPELTGATALGALASSLALAGGWSLLPALSLWLVLAARTIPSILYVRARLRLSRGEQQSRIPSLLASLLAFVLVLILVVTKQLPILVLFAFALLLIRAALGLSSFRRPIEAKIIGFAELAFGLLLVLSFVIGYRIVII